MPTSPNAWLPFSRIRRDLLALCRALRIERGDFGRGGVSELPDGRRMITPPPTGDSDVAFRRFPAQLIEGGILIPPVTVDFFDVTFVDSSWLAVPSGDLLLRLTIPATANTADAVSSLWPVNVTLGAAVWSLVPYVGSPPSEESGIPTGSERDYYWHPLRITDGVIVDRYLPVFFYGTPPQIFA